MKKLKNLWLGAKIALAVIRLIPLYPKLKKYSKSGPLDMHKLLMREVKNQWSHDFLKYSKVTLEVVGEKNIPKEPMLVVANHQGYFDIPVIFQAFKSVQLGFVAKESLFKIPVFGHWIKAVNSISLDREDPRESLKSINEGIEILKSGCNLAIFPEGTRSKTEEIGEFKKGSLRLATKSKATIVPVSILGTCNLYEKPGVATPGHVKVIIHEPIETAGLSKAEQNELNDQVYETIKKGLLQ